MALCLSVCLSGRGRVCLLYIVSVGAINDGAVDSFSLSCSVVLLTHKRGLLRVSRATILVWSGHAMSCVEDDVPD